MLADFLVEDRGYQREEDQDETNHPEQAQEGSLHTTMHASAVSSRGMQRRRRVMCTQSAVSLLYLVPLPRFWDGFTRAISTYTSNHT
jgi:hypothetical protein